MLSKNLANYRLLLASNAVFSFAFGVFTPFWIIFIQGFGGGLQQLGIALGLMALAQSVTSYFAGRWSDRLGRKPFVLFPTFALSAVTLGYAFVNSIHLLYVLQVANGIISAMLVTALTAFLGDLTKKVSRGTDIGKFHAVVGIAAAIGIIAGGFILSAQDMRLMFYFTAALILISGVIVALIKE
ncbi:MFS transporter [Candidatus Woesearchaeota archaeon]|nr:MFS transporter [Candidatus Woesearchaeota archaeon]